LSKYFKQKVSEDVFKMKYQVRGENSPEEVFQRVAEEIAEAENTPEKKEYWRDRFYDAIYNGEFIPAGRPLANARIDTPMKQYLNCFVINIEDSMDSITEALSDYMKILKESGGVGFSLSKLRPAGASLSKGGESTGPLSFARIFNEASKTISALNRRGATMMVLDISHPDIEEFITIKRGDENKELTQANISVAVSNAFMEALENKEKWDLTFEGKVYKTVNATDLWDKIMENSMKYAEPGVLFIDKINSENNLTYLYKLEATNPCFTGDTLVNTENVVIPIKDLAEIGHGDFTVPSAKGQSYINNGHHWSIGKQKAKAFCTGYKKVITIGLSNGVYFTCTPDHFLALSYGGYIEASKSLNSYLYSTYINDRSMKIEDDKKEAVYVEDVIDSGEVALVYDLTVEEDHNFFIKLYKEDQTSCDILVHNCGEQPLPAFTAEDGSKHAGACDLGSINLNKMVIDPFTSNAKFNWPLLQTTIITGVRFLDNVIDRIKLPLESIENDMYSTRRIGLGFMGLGDMFAKLGIEYGTTKSKKFASELTKTIKEVSYLSSVDLAVEKGSFPDLDKYGRDKYLNSSDFMKRMDADIKNIILKKGIRNAFINSLAPSGTIALTVGQNTSGGVEPPFALQYDRKIRTEKSEEDFFTETVYDAAWLEYLDYLKDNHFEFNGDVPSYFKVAHDIDPYDKIDVIANIQEHIDTAISNTTNLPKEFTMEEYKNLYAYGYKKGLKGLTTFWDGGNLAPILSTETVENKDRVTPARPKDLPCVIKNTKVKGINFTILIGLLDGKPYEIFVTHDDPLLKGATEGVITKRGKNTYDLYSPKDNLVIKDLSKAFDQSYGVLSRLVSMSLRHEVPLQFIVGQLLKGKEFVSFEKAVARELKKFIGHKEKVLVKATCEECGSSNLIYIEGCKTCADCNWSKCD